MRVELREFEGEDLLLFFPEDGPESMALDMLGKPGDHIYGQLRLADGYGEYYMMFKTSDNPVVPAGESETVKIAGMGKLEKVDGG